MTAEPPDMPPAQDFWAQLTDATQNELTQVLQVRIPDALRAIRATEQATGYTSDIANNNLVDVLSHISTLALGSGRLSPSQQEAQIARINDHLGRVLIDHPEEVVRLRLGDVADRWLDYQREVIPLRERGIDAPGAPPHQELEKTRQRIDVLFESARSAKASELTWDETLNIAAEMTEAAVLTLRMAEQLEQALGAYRNRIKPESTPDCATTGIGDSGGGHSRRVASCADDTASTSPPVSKEGTRKFDVLLAHHSGDKPLVRQIAEHLRLRGLSPWLDEEQIPPGRWFQDPLQDAIRDSLSAAIIIGPSGLGRWQEVETRALLQECVERDVPVIPVLLPGATIPSPMLFLRQLNWVQFNDSVDDDHALDRLVWGVSGARYSA
jgi:hypothetical protein